MAAQNVENPQMERLKTTCYEAQDIVFRSIYEIDKKTGGKHPLILLK